MVHTDEGGHGRVDHLRGVDDALHDDGVGAVELTHPLDLLAAFEAGAAGHGNQVGSAEERVAVVDVAEVGGPGLVVAAGSVLLTYPYIKYPREVVDAIDAVAQRDGIARTAEVGVVLDCGSTHHASHDLLGRSLGIVVVVGNGIVAQLSGQAAVGERALHLTVDIVVLNHSILGIAGYTTHTRRSAGSDEADIVVGDARKLSSTLGAEETVVGGLPVKVTGDTTQEDTIHTVVVVDGRVFGSGSVGIAIETSAVDGIAHELDSHTGIADNVILRMGNQTARVVVGHDEGGGDVGLGTVDHLHIGDARMRGASGEYTGVVGTADKGTLKLDAFHTGGVEVAEEADMRHQGLVNDDVLDNHLLTGGQRGGGGIVVGTARRIGTHAIDPAAERILRCADGSPTVAGHVVAARLVVDVYLVEVELAHGQTVETVHLGHEPGQAGFGIDMQVVVVGGQSVAGNTGRSEVGTVVRVIGIHCLLVPICFRGIVGNDVGILVGHHVVAL